MMCQTVRAPAQARFDAAIRQKQALEDDAASTARRMAAANALLGALAGEEGRWTQLSKDFDDQIQRLTGALRHACQLYAFRLQTRHGLAVILCVGRNTKGQELDRF